MTAAFPQYRLFRFENLPRYSRPEAALCDWVARTVPGEPAWKTWIADAFGAFLERPAGIEVELAERSAVDAAAVRTHTLTKEDISIGREPANDVCLALRSVGRRHARILTRAGGCSIEDLGTALGTHLNGARLAPHQPQPLASGDELTIFPFTFKVDLRPRWERDDRIDVHAGLPEPMSWRAFLATASADRLTFRLDLLPAGATACLEAGRLFLDEFLDRVLAPFAVRRTAGSADFDNGLYELFAAVLAERAGRDLAFPLQVAVGPAGSRPACPPETRGLALAFSALAAGITGAFRLFVPVESLAARPPAPPARPEKSVPPFVFRFPVSAGSVELSAAELAAIEASDVLLLDPQAALLLPNDFGRGWRLSNLEERRLDNYFEVEQLNDQAKPPEEAAAAAPDFSQLPVRVHVVVGEKEMTLAEAGGLVAGSIVELDATPSDPVRLAVNGRVIGEGRLVEIEGRLGVRITGWRGPR